MQCTYTKDEQTDKPGVMGTPEATYISGLKWTFNGSHYLVRDTTEAIRTKLGEIFNKWRIGWHADKIVTGPKPGYIVYVSKRQFDRVDFKVEDSCDAACDNESRIES